MKKSPNIWGRECFSLYTMLYYYYLFFAIAFLSYRPANTFDHDVQPHCPPEEEVCEFDWVVDYIETMIYYDESGAGDPVVVRNGSLFRRSSCNTYIPIDIAKGKTYICPQNSDIKI